jgi:hypothetical protein
MTTIRKKLIRLAHENPEIRPHILPLLQGNKTGAVENPNQLKKRLVKELAGLPISKAILRMEDWFLYVIDYAMKNGQEVAVAKLKPNVQGEFSDAVDTFISGVFTADIEKELNQKYGYIETENNKTETLEEEGSKKVEVDFMVDDDPQNANDAWVYPSMSLDYPPQVIAYFVVDFPKLDAIYKYAASVLKQKCKIIIPPKKLMQILKVAKQTPFLDNIKTLYEDAASEIIAEHEQKIAETAEEWLFENVEGSVGGDHLEDQDANYLDYFSVSYSVEDAGTSETKLDLSGNDLTASITLRFDVTPNITQD